MKPICYIAHHTLSNNGWGRVCRMVVETAKLKHLNYILLANEPGHLVRTLFTPVRDSRFKPFLAATDVKRNRAKLQNSAAIHCLTEPMIPFALLAHQQFSIPLFINLYGTYAVSSLSGSLAHIYKKAYLCADKIFVPSGFTADRLLEVMPELKPKIKIVPLGATFAKVKSPATFIERKVSVLFVGEIKKRKGVMELLEAANVAIKNKTLSTVFIAGKIIDRDYYNRLLQFIKTSGIESNVHFEGEVSDDRLSELYSNCRVSVLASIGESSKFEGFGLVHLESFAHATPSIGCLNSGSESVVMHNINGMLVNAGDIAQLTAAIETMLIDEQKWNYCSMNALKSMVTWDSVIEEYTRIYSSSSSGGTLIPA